MRSANALVSHALSDLLDFLRCERISYGPKSHDFLTIKGSFRDAHAVQIERLSKHSSPEGCVLAVALSQRQRYLTVPIDTELVRLCDQRSASCRLIDQAALCEQIHNLRGKRDARSLWLHSPCVLCITRLTYLITKGCVCHSGDDGLVALASLRRVRNQRTKLGCEWSELFVRQDLMTINLGKIVETTLVCISDGIFKRVVRVFLDLLLILLLTNELQLGVVCHVLCVRPQHASHGPDSGLEARWHNTHLLCHP